MVEIPRSVLNRDINDYNHHHDYTLRVSFQQLMAAFQWISDLTLLPNDEA